MPLRHVTVGTYRSTQLRCQCERVNHAADARAHLCKSIWIIIIHFSQSSHHSTTTMLRKQLIYRNTDGADGLSRRIEDMKKRTFFFWKPQCQVENMINIDMYERTIISLTWKASRSFPLKSMMSEEPAVPFSPG